MLLELGIGDAFGAGREYAPPADVAKNNDGKTYVQHQKWADLTPGRYTDDTQMSIAVAEFLLSKQPINTLNLANMFVHAFKRDERAGYSGGFYLLLQSVQDGAELLARIQPDSNRSGGAMRASPCGLLATVDEVRDTAMWQASITHATCDGMNAAAAAALMTFACRNGCDRDFLPSFLNDTVPGYGWDKPWQGPVGASGIGAVMAALTAIVKHDTLHDILVESVAFTGDVDTVAAIAMGAASLHPGITKNLHSNLYRDLENGPYGWSYLKDLDARLMKAFPLGETQAEEPGDVISDMFG